MRGHCLDTCDKQAGHRVSLSTWAIWSIYSWHSQRLPGCLSHSIYPTCRSKIVTQCKGIKIALLGYLSILSPKILSPTFDY